MIFRSSGVTKLGRTSSMNIYVIHVIICVLVHASIAVVGKNKDDQKVLWGGKCYKSLFLFFVNQERAEC